MNTELIRSFALLFGATIALICAVYVALGISRRKKQLQESQQQTD